MVLKDNYFGSFTHYSTLAEFLEKQKAGGAFGGPGDQEVSRGTGTLVRAFPNLLC